MSEYEKWIEALYEQASNENDPEAARLRLADVIYSEIALDGVNAAVSLKTSCPPTLLEIGIYIR